MQQVAAAKPPTTRANSQAPNETQPISAPIESQRAQPISDVTKVSFDDSPAYISDDEEDDEGPSNHRSRRSKRAKKRLHNDERKKLHRIVNLVAHEKATLPDLTINTQRKLSRGLTKANEDLQLGEWAHGMHFAGAIIDEETGKSLEY